MSPSKKNRVRARQRVGMNVVPSAESTRWDVYGSPKNVLFIVIFEPSIVVESHRLIDADADETLSLAPTLELT
jgi:hypothetical protein